MASTNRRTINMSSNGNRENNGGCYLETAFFSLIFVVVVKIFWPETIPFTMFQFFHFNAPIGDVLAASWPIFAWGVGASAYQLVRTLNPKHVNRNAEQILSKGFEISLFAGVFEEISFRWLIFYDAIVAAKITNFLLLGFAGHGITEWLYTSVFGPVANFVTLGILEPYLLNGFGWAVGMAIIVSNGKFQNGHTYQGWFGWVNSWFMGMFFFYLMFKYGLLASMLVHFLYDFFIFSAAYIDAAIERKKGFV